MKKLSDLGFSESCLQSNIPVVLDRGDRLLQIKSGAIAMFAVETMEGELQGERHYLFDLEQEGELFGWLPELEGLSYQLLAVPYEDTEVICLEFANKNLDISLLEKWSQDWGDRLGQIFVGTEIVLPQFDSCDGESLQEKLATLHLYFRYGWHQFREQETQTNSSRFQDRLRLNEEVRTQAIASLTTVFRRKQQDFVFTQENPLLAAVEAVGQAKGIKVQAPPKHRHQTGDSFGTHQGMDLAKIAYVSRFRTRRVKLSGKWWTTDCGALLAYAADDSRPLAILPQTSGRYEVFDPTLQQRFPLTPKTAQQLSRFAYTFYRSFPDQAMSAIAVVKFAFQGKERDIITIFVIGIVASLIGMIIPFTTGILIETIIPDGKKYLLVQMGLCFLAISFGSTLFGITQWITGSRLQTFADVETQSAVWDRLLKLKVGFFRNYTVGDLQSRVSAVIRIRHVLSGTVLETIFSSIFTVLNLGLMLFYSPSLTLVAIAMVVLLILVANLVGFQTLQKVKPLLEMQGQLSGLTVQLISGVAKLRVAGAEQRAFAFWSRKFSEQLELDLSTEALEDWMTLFMSVLSIANPVILFSFAATQLPTNGSMGVGLSTGAFLAFNSAFGIFFGGATSLGGLIMQLISIAILWDRARPIVEALPEVDREKVDPGALLGAITLDHVGFRYQGDRPPAIDDISLEIKPGEFVAIVGPSGSGKSTLVRLLLGFESPQTGKIYYDDQDLAGLDAIAIRRQLGVVLQNSRIDGASVFDNIAGGMPITLKEAWAAARLAGFAEEITAMPMGMHTVISEGGRNLSGGQRQRLLIARALRLQPKVIIFDEATSSLDNHTQATITENLDRIQATRIIIAHRLSTVQNADRIYVLAAGKIAQQGTFKELMQQQGLFLDLMTHQLK